MTVAEYTTQLQAGLGMIGETVSLLSLWEPGMNVPQLCSAVLDEGIFPTMSARRIRNVVAECFAPRYLSADDQPAMWLKALAARCSNAEMKQLFFLYTCRANEILADFVREIYWAAYAAGKSELTIEDARAFVERSNQVGKTSKLWADSTVRRVSSYLIGCCADFGLLESGSRKSVRKLTTLRILRPVALYLAYELHLKPMGDNAVAGHTDWRLFGLDHPDLIEQWRLLSLDGHLVLQVAGGVVRVGWKYSQMEEVIDVIGR